MNPISKMLIGPARRVLLLVALLMIVAFPCWSQTQTSSQKEDAKYWALSRKYCNPRFGFCVRYPASLVNDKAPENDDGRRFDNGNGLEVTASGINNAAKDTLAGEMRSARDGFDRVTYQAKGANWFVLSGLKKGATDAVVYLKTYIGRGSVNHLEITYPVPLKENYRTVVGNIARSFKPGQLGVAH
ncbi:MAG TPA: hypothetical protein VE961_25730 [Pyrinomonadaceae bacterium]|nr:hypothetical protein [Pyrinomonadaceae bacterium]